MPRSSKSKPDHPPRGGVPQQRRRLWRELGWDRFSVGAKRAPLALALNRLGWLESIAIDDPEAISVALEDYIQAMIVAAAKPAEPLVKSDLRPILITTPLPDDKPAATVGQPRGAA
jgi:hypothetical protein